MAIRDALLNNETETLNHLLYAKEMDAKTTWDVVYANAALNKVLGLSDEQYNAMMKNLKNLRSLGDSVQYSIDKTTDSLKEQSSALDDILKYVMDLIKWETQNKIKALNDEIDIFEELINLRKQELREMEKKRDFEKSLAKQTKELSKLQLELAKLNSFRLSNVNPEAQGCAA